jgi:hypothetical protein
MGITTESITGMFYAAKNGVKFTNTAMIARQAILMTKGTAKNLLKKFDGGGGGNRKII